jgi:hypothetical protein
LVLTIPPQIHRQFIVFRFTDDVDAEACGGKKQPVPALENRTIIGTRESLLRRFRSEPFLHGEAAQQNSLATGWTHDEGRGLIPAFNVLLLKLGFTKPTV